MTGPSTQPPVLPDAPWRRMSGLVRVIDALGPGNARVVGGAVRDTLLGLAVSDVDVATRLLPHDVIDALEATRIKAVPTGLAHGTVTAVADGAPIEVTTLRHDVATDGRHATVEFTDDWQADAARRDFTINALYADPASGTIFDYFGGLDDLAARRVRFIGDPLQRIAEDHLRILRFFRFFARFGDTPDEHALAACTARANDLMALSRERIRDELLKLLVAPKAVEVVRLMVDRGILRPVVPEIAAEGVDRLAALAAREATPDPFRRLVALLGDAAAVDAVGARLKLSNAERKRIASAAQPAGDGSPRALAYRIGVEGARDRLLLAGQPTDAIEGWTPPALPISGGEIVARGVGKGPLVAATLRRIEDRWVAGGFPESIETIVDEEVDQALREAR